jgi:hypothetical protein
MKLSPTRQQDVPSLPDKPHRSASFGSIHASRPYQPRLARGIHQVNLGLAVPEDMHMRRMVVVGEDNHPQAASRKNGHHCHIT